MAESVCSSIHLILWERESSTTAFCLPFSTIDSVVNMIGRVLRPYLCEKKTTKDAMGKKHENKKTTKIYTVYKQYSITITFAQGYFLD